MITSTIRTTLSGFSTTIYSRLPGSIGISTILGTTTETSVSTSIATTTATIYSTLPLATTTATTTATATSTIINYVYNELPSTFTTTLPPITTTLISISYVTMSMPMSSESGLIQFQLIASSTVDTSTILPPPPSPQKFKTVTIYEARPSGVDDTAAANAHYITSLVFFPPILLTYYYISVNVSVTNFENFFSGFFFP